MHENSRYCEILLFEEIMEKFPFSADYVDRNRTLVHAYTDECYPGQP